MQGSVGRGAPIRQQLDAVALCQLRHRVANAKDLELGYQIIVSWKLDRSRYIEMMRFNLETGFAFACM